MFCSSQSGVCLSVRNGLRKNPKSGLLILAIIFSMFRSMTMILRELLPSKSKRSKSERRTSNLAARNISSDSESSGTQLSGHVSSSGSLLSDQDSFNK